MRKYLFPLCTAWLGAGAVRDYAGQQPIRLAYVIFIIGIGLIFTAKEWT